jgi:hypothetical protein
MTIVTSSGTASPYVTDVASAPIAPTIPAYMPGEIALLPDSSHPTHLLPQARVRSYSPLPFERVIASACNETKLPNIAKSNYSRFHTRKLFAIGYREVEEPLPTQA